jgi:hypothetical protein
VATIFEHKNIQYKKIIAQKTMKEKDTECIR